MNQIPLVHSHFTGEMEPATIIPPKTYPSGWTLTGIADVDALGLFEQCSHSGHSRVRCLCPEHSLCEFHDFNGPSDADLQKMEEYAEQCGEKEITIGVNQDSLRIEESKLRKFGRQRRKLLEPRKEEFNMEERIYEYSKRAEQELPLGDENAVSDAFFNFFLKLINAPGPTKGKRVREN